MGIRMLDWARGGVFVLLCSQSLHAAPGALQPLAERTEAIVGSLGAGALQAVDDGQAWTRPELNLVVHGCAPYPYSEDAHGAAAGARLLLDDLAQGLRKGLQCLGGQGPAGRLHSYHEYQAHRLLTLLESDRRKTFQCVEDQMFATAVATSPRGVSAGDPLYRQLRQVKHPGVVFDTFRLGGVLSRQYDDETYQAFFHLRDEQILEHRNGQPLRPANLHRYRNRPALVFHELVHWLGHEHSAIRPDLTMLYETCCFGGSDYISDAGLNRDYQARACTILKDDGLWSSSYHPYKQMRVWHHRGYDQLKGDMRADFDS
jgi:hypothetical protein